MTGPTARPVAHELIILIGCTRKPDLEAAQTVFESITWTAPEDQHRVANVNLPDARSQEIDILLSIDSSYVKDLS
jgi:hypothetical protein